MGTRAAAGGGRLVEVPPERLVRWLENFAARHGGAPSTTPGPGGLSLAAPDGATAEAWLPFGGSPAEWEELVALASEPRRIGLLLARRGGFAAGIADGATLTASKVERRYVQGRTAAGGWSQQRFARRRANQARQGADAAADAVARLLLPESDRLHALVVGGDRQAVDAVLSDRRLAPLAAKVAGWFLTVPEPRHSVLTDAARLARVVRIRVIEPASASA
ncbi:MAG TPA: acVLRF1 family peptidyl-tRNA hydrolase [Micromonosporaceae bacterium]